MQLVAATVACEAKSATNSVTGERLSSSLGDGCQILQTQAVRFFKDTKIDGCLIVMAKTKLLIGSVNSPYHLGTAERQTCFSAWLYTNH